MNVLIAFKMGQTFNRSMHEIQSITYEPDGVDDSVTVIETNGRRHTFRLDNILNISIL